MLYYVLPGIGIYGGVKKGFHCADFLTEAGHPCAVASPAGERPQWFPTRAAVLRHSELRERCTPDDTVLFSCPADAPFVDELPAGRKIVHMQGANTAADHALFDRGGYEFISHGLHMTAQLLRHGLVAPQVPMGIPDVFRWNGEPKAPFRIAVMPRKGADILSRLRSGLPKGCGLELIDGRTEAEVAHALKAADFFLAISTNEALGLPPLEAMSAGCCVVGYPGDGGFEFMRHRDTAWVVPNGDFDGLLGALHHLANADAEREAIRARGVRLAAEYTMDREREFLFRALGLRGHEVD